MVLTGYCWAFPRVYLSKSKWRKIWASSLSSSLWAGNCWTCFDTLVILSKITTFIFLMNSCWTRVAQFDPILVPWGCQAQAVSSIGFGPGGGLFRVGNICLLIPCSILVISMGLLGTAVCGTEQPDVTHLFGNTFSPCKLPWFLYNTAQDQALLVVASNLWKL